MQPDLIRQTVRSLQIEYPGAMYAYLKIVNQQEQMQRFLNEEIHNPHFNYAASLSQKVMRHRLQSLRAEWQLADAHDNDPAKRFVSMRIQETLSLLRLIHLRQTDILDLSMAKKTYSDHMQRLYGPLEEDYFKGILQLLAARPKKGDQREIWRQFLELLDTTEDKLLDLPPLYHPSAKTFHGVRRYIQELYPEFWALLMRVATQEKPFTPQQRVGLFEEGIQILGADKLGWKVRISRHSVRIMVSKRRKRVLVGEQLQPRSNASLAQLLAHELLGHVQRDMGGVEKTDGSEQTEEGIAVICEQAVLPKYSHKRLMRYLAACLATGVDGIPRDFRATHELLWRAFVCLNNAPLAEAKIRAFNECVRIFRGGVPNVPGLIYLKDKIYLEGNLYTWQVIENEGMTKDQFQKLLTQDLRVPLGGDKTL